MRAKILAGFLAVVLTGGDCLMAGAVSAQVKFGVGAPITGPRPDVGIVFQQPTLLPWQSTLDNVLLPVRTLGLDLQAGATTHDEAEANVNHAMAARAAQVVIVADSSKLSVHAFARICAVAEIDLGGALLTPGLVVQVALGQNLAAGEVEGGQAGGYEGAASARGWGLRLEDGDGAIGGQNRAMQGPRFPAGLQRRGGVLVQHGGPEQLRSGNICEGRLRRGNRRGGRDRGRRSRVLRCRSTLRRGLPLHRGRRRRGLSRGGFGGGRILRHGVTSQQEKDTRHHPPGRLQQQKPILHPASRKGEM